jgi:hypothetical protein
VQNTPAIIIVFQLQRLDGRARRIVAVQSGDPTADDMPPIETKEIWSTSFDGRTELIGAVPYDAPVPGCYVFFSTTNLDLKEGRLVTTYLVENIHPDVESTGAVAFLEADWPEKVPGATYRPVTVGGHIRSGDGIIVVAQRQSEPGPDVLERALVALRLTTGFNVDAEAVITSATSTHSSPAGYPEVAITPVTDGDAGWILIVGSGRRPMLFYVGPRTTTVGPDFTCEQLSSFSPPALPPPPGFGVPWDEIKQMSNLRIAGGASEIDTSIRGRVGQRFQILVSGIVHSDAFGHYPGTPPQTFCVRGTLNLRLAGLSFLFEAQAWKPRVERLDTGVALGPVQVIDDPNTRSHWYVAEYWSSSATTVVVNPNTVRHVGDHGIAYDRFDSFKGSQLALGFQWRTTRRSIGGHLVMAWGSEAVTGGPRGVFVEHRPRDSWLGALRTEDPGHPEIRPEPLSPTARMSSLPIAGHRAFRVELWNGPPDRFVTLRISPHLRRADAAGIFVDLSLPGTVAIPAMTTEGGLAQLDLDLSGSDRSALAPVFNAWGTARDGEHFTYPRVLVFQWVWEDPVLAGPITSPLEDFDPEVIFVRKASNVLYALIGRW